MADDLKSTLQRDLNKARKARDKLRTTVLSTLLSDLRNKEIEQGSTGDDDTVRDVVTRAMKQRREAAGQMRDGGREELAEKEEAEAEILKVYLPPAMDEAEVRALIQEIVSGGADQLGAVMGQLMPRIKGRFDGGEANRIVREELGA